MTGLLAEVMLETPVAISAQQNLRQEGVFIDEIEKMRVIFPLSSMKAVE